MSQKHTPFPYTEDFRKAKRNSLVWSGITIAASLGNPTVPNAPVTMGQLGLNLGFSQSLIIFMSGTVAVFMALGFWQAFRRMRLFASELFAGETDADQVFKQLTATARTANQHLAKAEGAIGAAIGAAQSIVDDARMRLNFDQEETRPPTPGQYSYILRQLDEPTLAQKYEVARGELDHWVATVSEYYNRRNADFAAKTADAVAQLEKLSQSISEAAIPRIQAFRDVDKTHYDDLYTKVVKLTRLHSNIYREERWWFWAFDVGVVAVMFVLAMSPYLQLWV